jgi:CheY-like chemotaxis protein
MQDIGRELLEEQGYTVLIARDGQEAIEIFRSRVSEIDLVILDLVMPRLDGGQAYLEMKKIKNDLQALFCTGYASDELIQSLLRQENLKVLQKPFRSVEFVKLVNELLTTATTQ